MTHSIASPADRQARMDLCRACMDCGVTIDRLASRAGYATSTCPRGRWGVVTPCVSVSVVIPAEVRESLAAESHARLEAAVANRGVADGGQQPSVPVIQRVADLAEKCAVCEQDHAEWGSTEESPGGQVVGCELITSAVIQGHCLSCPKGWQAAVASGIPPRGCQWRVERRLFGDRSNGRREGISARPKG